MNEQIKQRIEQIRRGEVPEGYKKTKVGLVPEEWEIKKLSDISDEIKEVAGTGKYETLSISAGIGFVNQANKFGKELSGKQYEKYTVLRKGDFAYNKGNSKKYPQGCVYRLKDRDSAAVPNVFECFRIKEGNKNYIEQVFISGFLNRQLSKKINHGVRDDGLLNLTGEDFYKSYIIIPPLPEQEKIAEILQTQDKVIELQQKKIDELKRLKKGYLSKMFPKKGCNVPEIRFPGFTDAWEQRKLGDNIIEYTETTTKNNQYPPLTSSRKGIFLQTEYFAGNQIASDDNTGYNIVPYGYFTYRHMSDDEIFHFNINDIVENGIVSTLYPVFTTDENLDSRYLQYQLNYGYEFAKFAILQKQGGSRTYMYLNKLKQLYLTMPKSVEEQNAISAFFMSLDHLITLHQRKCDEEKQKKKALMQLLLTGVVRT